MYKSEVKLIESNLIVWRRNYATSVAFITGYERGSSISRN